MNLLIIYTALIITTIQQSLANSGKQVSSIYTLQSNVAYDLNFTLNTVVKSGSSVIISFGSQFRIPPTQLSNCMASTSSSTAPSTTNCSASYNSGQDIYSITMPNIYQSEVLQTFLRIRFNITNPWGQTSGRLDVSIKELGQVDPLQSITFYIDFVASNLSSCSYTSLTPITGDNTTHIIKFTPTKNLISGQYIMVTLPMWFVGNSTQLTSVGNSTLTCTGIKNTDNVGLPCSLTNPSSTQLIRIDNFVSSNKTSPGEIQINMSPLKNPYSLQTLGPITFQIYYTGLLVSQRCTGVYHTVTQPNSFKSLSFNISNLSISATNSNITITLGVTNPLTRNRTRLRVQFSNQTTVSFSGIGGTILSQNSTLIIFTSIVNADRVVGGLTFMSFSITTPPSTRTFTFKFTTQFIDNSSNTYDIDTISRSFTNNPGSITSTGITVGDPTINVQTNYQINLRITNRLAVNSFIQIIFPSSLTIDPTATCNDNVTNSSTCSVNTNNLTINMNGSVAAGTVFNVTVSKVKNAAQSQATSTFRIYSYFDSLYNSLVDQLLSGLTVTMTPNSLTAASITPTSSTTYTVTSYKIDFTLKDSIPIGGYIQIEFPATVIPMSGSVSIMTASFGFGSCLLALNSSILRINSCFASTSLSAGPISITLNNIRNPTSYRPSDSFKIRTYSAVPSLLNYINTTLSVQMNSPYLIATFTANPQNNIVHASSLYTMNIVHAVPCQLNDYILLNVDSTMDILNNVSCTAVSGITTLSCLRISNSQLKVTYTSLPSSQSIQYQVNPIVNYDVANTPITFELTVYTFDNFIKEKATTTNSYSKATISTFTVNNDDTIILYGDSKITLTLTSPFSISSAFDVNKTKLQIFLPMGFVSQANTTCLVPQGTCSRISTTKFQITNIGLGFNSYAIVMSNIQTPLITVQSGSFQIIYTYDAKNVSFVDTGVVVRPFCTSPCKACNTTQTKCLSCLPAPNTDLFYNSANFTCLSACPNGTYPDSNKICQACTNPCNTCYNDSSCSSCVANKWLYLMNCSDTCPDRYYKGSTGICQNCVGFCDLCKSQTECLSCLTNFYYNFSCVPESSCPVGTYGNITTLVCQTCKSPCSTCLKQQSNCTACVSPNLYYDNKCVLSCPDGMYKSGLNCLNCTGLCNTCSNSTSCLTCKSDYLYNGSCILASNCPVGTYPNDTEKKCSTCPIGCTICNSSISCSACDTNFYVFYNFSCLVSCPNGTYKSGFTCQACQPPCVNCQTTATNCLSCTGGTYLFNGTCNTTCPLKYYQNINVCTACKTQCADCVDGASCSACTGLLFLTISGQCLNACPNGFFKNTVNNKCDACTGPCANCDISAGNCTSCIGSRVLNGNDCSSSSCPVQYFNVSGICKTCSNCVNCLTADTCTQCKPGFFIYAGLCYASCPSTAPIADLPTQSCTLCDVSCFTCTGSAKNCTGCNQGQYLFNSGCFSSCPSGFVQNAFQRSCQPRQISSIFYFPCMFAVLAVFIIALYSKWAYRESQFITILTAMISMLCFLSWVIFFVIMSQFQHSIQKQLTSNIVIITLIVIVISLFLGIFYQIYLRCSFDCDAGYSAWIQHDQLNLKIYKIMVMTSAVNFIFYRFLYGRLFHRIYFSLCYADGERFLSNTHRFSLFAIFFQLFPMIGISFYTIYSKKIYDQTVYSALDTLIINVFLVILLFIDGSKSGEQFFGELRKNLPYKVQTKGKYVQVDSMMSIAEMQDFMISQKRVKTQIQEKQKENFFRKISCIQNLNKFGHLNQYLPKQQQKAKSLPQKSKLHQLPQYQPNAYQDDHNVIDDLFLAREQEQLQNLRIQEQKQKQQKEKEKARLQQQKKRKQQQQRVQRQRKQEEQRLENQRLQKMLEDQLEQENLQCIDIAAIDKAQNKNRQKKSPLGFLSKCKTVDDKPVDQKAVKKLQQIAKKNGIDPQFMKQTFGVQKNHNQDLLNSIIDKHNHVNRQAVKQMFKQTNNKQILQQLFGKNSTVDTQKLKQLMNDKEGLKMIEKLMDQQKGIVSADIAKVLLDKNSKFKPQFTKKLLSGEIGADEKKLQQLLRNGQNEKARQQNLKALKKIGGENLQNKQMIESMLGQNSKLNPQSFSSVAMNLSMKALQSLFGNPNPQNTKVIQKILNNKKLNLKQLSPILQDQELIYEIGKNLGNQNPVLEENLMNLIKNCVGKVDQEVLKKFLQNQTLVEKLMGGSAIDPQALIQLLQNDVLNDPQLVEELEKILSNQNPKVQENIINLLKKSGGTADPQRLKAFLKNPTLVEKLIQNSTTDPTFLNQILSKDSKIDLNLLQKTIKQMPVQQLKRIFEPSSQKNIDFKALSKIFQQNSNTDPQLVKKMMDPQLIQEVFTKNNNISTNMLAKLVEKGSKFDKQNIVNIYGKSTNNVFNNQNGPFQSTSFDPQGGFMNGMNRNNLKGNKNQQFIRKFDQNGNEITNSFDNLQGNQTEYDFKFTFNKTANQNFNVSQNGQMKNGNSSNQFIMSRTDGGMMGFLNPLNLKQQKSKIRGSMDQRDELTQLDRLEDDQQDDLGEQYINQQAILQQEDQEGLPHTRKRKPPTKKRKLKKITDIRHPAQKIYLQPIVAPHQMQMSKNFRKKKKRDQNQSATKLIMDEDNDVFDIDF